MRKCFIVRSVLNIKFTLSLLLFWRLASCDSGIWRYHLKSNDTSIGYWCRSGRHNLQSFIAANSTQNYFFIARMLSFLWHSRQKCRIYHFATKCDKFLYRKWIEREEIKREWGNVEKEYLSISSSRLQRVAQPCFFLVSLASFAFLSLYSLEKLRQENKARKQKHDHHFILT